MGPNGLCRLHSFTGSLRRPFAERLLCGPEEDVKLEPRSLHMKSSNEDLGKSTRISRTNGLHPLNPINGQRICE